MHARAIWGLSLGLLGAASSARAAPPEGPAEPSAPLPRYDEAPIAVEPAAPIVPMNVPPTGVGLMVSGSLTLAGGSAMFGLAAAGIWKYNHDTSDDDEECDEWSDTCESGDPYAGLVLLIEIPVLIVGASLVATGGTLLGIGVAKHRSYRKWERKQVDGPVPPMGDGMLGSGVTLILTGVTAGALTLAIGGGPDSLKYPGLAASFTTSVVATLGGTGLVIGSRFLRRKHMRWQNASMTPLVAPLPGVRPGFGGLSFGVAGRF